MNALRAAIHYRDAVFVRDDDGQVWRFFAQWGCEHPYMERLTASDLASYPEHIQKLADKR